MDARQGDVKLIPVTTMPDGCKRVAREAGRIVLAHGEATGHAHAVLDRDAVLWETPGGQRILAVESEADLVHEEHDTVHLPKGLYRVVRQREATAGTARRVAD